MQEGDYNRRLYEEFEASDLEALQKRLGIGMVDYERGRDLSGYVPK